MSLDDTFVGHYMSVADVGLSYVEVVSTRVLVCTESLLVAVEK